MDYSYPNSDLGSYPSKVEWVHLQKKTNVYNIDSDSLIEV